MAKTTTVNFTFAANALLSSSLSAVQLDSAQRLTILFPGQGGGVGYIIQVSADGTTFADLYEAGRLVQLNPVDASALTLVGLCAKGLRLRVTQASASPVTVPAALYDPLAA